jgi:hypothetical protein
MEGFFEFPVRVVLLVLVGQEQHDTTTQVSLVRSSFQIFSTFVCTFYIQKI